MLLALVLLVPCTTSLPYPTCPYPADVPSGELPAYWTPTGNMSYSYTPSVDIFWMFCPYGPKIGQLGAGLKPILFLDRYRCDTAKSKWVNDNGYEAPPFMSCGEASWAYASLCKITDRQASGDEGGVALAPEEITSSEQYCPTGQTLQLANGTIVLSLDCQRTTTTTTLATTTVPADITPTATQLWNVMFYYNFALGVHAYCADSVCIKAIQSNGIGYDMVNGKGSMGRAVTESAIGAVRAACPTGSQNLRNLGFTKSGYKYLHNFNGLGLKQGWVAIVKGACGATNPVKRWKSRYTDDMMYGYDLEWNTWYKGMVQDGGKVHFWLF